MFAKLRNRNSARFETADGYAVGVVLTVPPFPYRYGYAEIAKGLPILIPEQLDAGERSRLHFAEVALAGGQLVTAGTVGYVMPDRSSRPRVSEAVSDLQEKLDPSAIQEELSATTASLVKKAQEFSRDNPLLVGAAGVVIGLAIGMAMPLTTGEGRVIGKLRDGLRGNARVLAGNAIDKVQGAVRRIAEPSAPKSDNQL